MIMLVFDGVVERSVSPLATLLFELRKVLLLLIHIRPL